MPDQVQPSLADDTGARVQAVVEAAEAVADSTFFSKSPLASQPTVKRLVDAVPAYYDDSAEGQKAKSDANVP